MAATISRPERPATPAASKRSNYAGKPPLRDASPRIRTVGRCFGARCRGLAGAAVGRWQGALALPPMLGAADQKWRCACEQSRRSISASRMLAGRTREVGIRGRLTSCAPSLRFPNSLGHTITVTHRSAAYVHNDGRRDHRGPTHHRQGTSRRLRVATAIWCKLEQDTKLDFARRGLQENGGWRPSESNQSEIAEYLQSSSVRNLLAPPKGALNEVLNKDTLEVRIARYAIVLGCAYICLPVADHISAFLPTLTDTGNRLVGYGVTGLAFGYGLWLLFRSAARRVCYLLPALLIVAQIIHSHFAFADSNRSADFLPV